MIFRIASPMRIEAVCCNSGLEKIREVIVRNKSNSQVMLSVFSIANKVNRERERAATR